MSDDPIAEFGTPPDFMAFREIPASHEAADVRGRIDEMKALQQRDGATFWRATLHEDGRLYLEGWRERPLMQGKFDPIGNCPHADIWFTWSVNHFTDRPGRVVSVDGTCKCCGAPMYFHGAPFGVSLNRPTTNLNKTELRFPVTVGDEKHEPGIEAMAGAVHVAPEGQQ